MACLWGGVGKRGGTEGFTWLEALIKAKVAPEHIYQEGRCIYGISLYWAIMTFTTIGYGDITPQSELEYWIASLCMAGMAAIWAYIIGEVCSIMASMRKDQKFMQTMDHLNWLT